MRILYPDLLLGKKTRRITVVSCNPKQSILPIEVFTTVPLVAQLLGGPPAVDDQLRAGNERRFIRGQIKRAVSNILRLPQPGKRRRVQSLSLELRVGDGFLRHISLDDSRMNRVTPDAIGGVLDCGGFGEKPHRSLGCTIGG